MEYWILQGIVIAPPHLVCMYRDGHFPSIHTSFVPLPTLNILLQRSGGPFPASRSNGGKATWKQRNIYPDPGMQYKRFIGKPLIEEMLHCCSWSVRKQNYTYFKIPWRNNVFVGTYKRRRRRKRCLGKEQEQVKMKYVERWKTIAWHRPMNSGGVDIRMGLSWIKVLLCLSPTRRKEWELFASKWRKIYFQRPSGRLLLPVLGPISLRAI